MTVLNMSLWGGSGVVDVDRPVMKILRDFVSLRVQCYALASKLYFQATAAGGRHLTPVFSK